MRTPSVKAKSSQSLQSVINATKKLWRQYHLTYDQTRYVAKEVRHALAVERPKTRKRVVARLSREEETRLIAHAYRMKGERGLLTKTLFQTGARVSEFVNLKAEDVFFDEQMILIAKAKGGKSRYVPILPELAQELRTHLGQRTVGYLFETNRATRYSPRRIQQIIKETAEQAQITKRVYPHLLRHSVATTLLERGMPIEQIQKFLGHSKLETTQLYAESSTAMMRVSATAWKRTKTGKMKMWHFPGIKFAAGLAEETHNPLPSHEIRRKRTRRQIFSLDAKKKITHFHTAGINTVSGRR